ncbi:hypothetical protein Anas_04232, partial [Armadillidium nasatum]
MTQNLNVYDDFENSVHRPSTSSDESEVLNPRDLSRRGSRWEDVLKTFRQGIIIMLIISACIRHTAGFTWAYNTQPFYNTYYPDYNLGIWITIISIVGGAVGVAVGGFTSDKIIRGKTLRSRIYVLAGSQ